MQSQSGVKVSVYDVASFVLNSLGTIPTMKLQKIVYYCQAYSLGWKQSPLFDEEIKAWNSGPVIPELYLKHKGVFHISPGYVSGNPDNLNDTQKAVCNAVISQLRGFTGYELSLNAKGQSPWRTFFNSSAERHNSTIPHSVLADFYSE